MIEKVKEIFKNKEKRMENLVSFLIILVITLIMINRILDSEEKKDYENEIGVELASEPMEDESKDDLEKRLEKILEKINGVGNVSVLITYSESKTIVPIYNVNSTQSKTEENDESGTKRTIETVTEEKEVIRDSATNMVTEKIIMPQIEGAIVIAQGASDSTIKGNIISAVEAVTGIATHKIQVYEMGDE